MRLNIPQCTGQLPQQREIQPKMLVVLRLRNPAMTGSLHNTQNYSPCHLLPSFYPAILQISLLPLWSSPLAAIYWSLSHYPSFLRDLSPASLSTSPRHFWHNSWGFPSPHLPTPCPYNSTLPQTVIPMHISQTLSVLVTVIPPLVRKILTLQLPLPIFPVHSLQYPNCKNYQTPLRSNSPDPIASSCSCPWSFTLWQTP